MERGGSYPREGYLRENYKYFHLRDTEGQELDFHFHEFDKIVILLSGQVEYMVESCTYPLRPWDILLIKHHAIHKALIDRSTPYERVILYLDGQYTNRSVPEGDLLSCFDRADQQGRYLLTPAAADREALTTLFDAMEKALDDEQFGAQALRDTFVIQLLIQINRIALRDGGFQSPETAYNPKIAQTLSYINEHLSEPLTVDELAGRVYLSRYHFMRLFKAQTGSTVHSYVQQRRLLYAAQLIRRGIPVSKAAEDSGFAEYSTFYRDFRAAFGISPKQLK
ncbi:MAG: AraC family transcriptional regulator [Oscillospiraceae bacterium]|nr:AraC family transcriptional regulator [Oscillospiraceae bacterium]